MATHSSTLAWKIPWMEEPGSPWRCKKLDTTEQLHLNLKKKKKTDQGDTKELELVHPGY